MPARFHEEAKSVVMRPPNCVPVDSGRRRRPGSGLGLFIESEMRRRRLDDFDADFA
jgi:hypothetical protein